MRCSAIHAALALIILASPLAAQTCPPNFAQVTAQQLGADSPLVSGVLTVTATNASQDPINFSVPTQGVHLMRPKQVPIVNGALTQTLCVPRSDLASIPVGYHFIAQDTSPTGGSAIVLDVANVAVTSSPFSLDAYPFTQAVNPYTLSAPTTFQGAWAAGTTYTFGNTVSFGGSTYVSLSPSNIGNTPSQSSTYWSLVAGVGATGPAGIGGTVVPVTLTGVQNGTNAVFSGAGCTITFTTPPASPPANGGSGQVLHVDALIAAGSTTAAKLWVYLDGILQSLNTDYTYTTP